MFSRRALVLLPIAAVVLAACGGGSSPSGGTAECTVGVSWNNFEQPRWNATDKPKMQSTIEDGGGTFIDADANNSNEQQLSDVDSLIEQGADVLVILAQDQEAILPAVDKAKQNDIPVIAYDRLTESPDVLYITFNNVGVGEAEAQAILDKVPSGNYVLIKGDPGDPNASTFLPQGWDNAGLKDKVDSGEITILNGPPSGSGTWPDDYGTYTAEWSTETAQNQMEAIIDAAISSGDEIDAILAENDSTALGVVGALTAKNYGFPPLSGQDGDKSNLNNLALGKQYVDVWKNSNELGIAAGQAALQLCEGKSFDEIAIDVSADVSPADGNSPTDFETPGGNTVKSLILKPTPLLAADLGQVFEAGWYVTKDEICAGVTEGDPGFDPCNQ
jgi:D-xylose transport system substrate-binding protein